MFVKKNLVLVIAASVFAPVLTMAAPTITFQGEVATQTCQAQVNGQSDTVVLLPTVSQSSLAAAGATTGITPFSISVKDCATAGADTEIKTKFLGRSVTAEGNLGNVATTNPATNVSIQLTSDAAGKTPVALNGVTLVDGLILKSGATSADHQFGAQYIAEGGAATAGAVTGVVEYTLSYQ
ncbi:fimbrial protein [Acinetobacter sp. 'aerobic (ED)']|uniref:fimbrial protein n=1 Tax=Acinetobacter sp. 'aerobic (ED)' TaxID=174230 RepID=UPI00192BEC40|nr:fimbrial protein [Acinetobacter sp. 'aerobic (ED)']